MTALRHELRRGLAVTVLPLLVLLHSLVVYRLTWRDSAVWLNLSSAVVSGSLLSGPLAAAMAAWVAMRERRRGTRYLRLGSARGEAAAPAVELLACVLVAMLAYAVALGGGAVTIMANATWSGPHWGWLVVGLLALVLQTVFGYVAGRLIPKVWTPPVLALALYLYEAWNLGNGGLPWAYLSPVSQQQVSVFRAVNPTMLLGQAVWYCALIALVVCAGLYLLKVGSRLSRSVPLALSAAVAVFGATIIISQHGHFLEAPRAGPYRCSTGQPVVCVHPAFSKGLPRLSALFASLRTKLDGTPLVFDRVQQLDRDPRVQPTAGSGRFALDGLSDADLRDALSEYLDYAQVGGPVCVGRAAGESGSAANVQMVRAWLVNDMREFTPTTEAQVGRLRWFANISEDARRAWLRQNYRALTTCSLGDSAFGTGG